MGFSLGDIPIVGDVYNGLRGNPDEIKAAYDKMMQTMQQGTSGIQQFLMGQQSKALRYFDPVQHMLRGAYGTEGIQGPQVPGAAGGNIRAMYGGK